MDQAYKNGAGGIPDETEALLEQLGIGKRKRRRGGKRLWLAIGGAALLAGGMAAGLFFYFESRREEESAPVYREYTVERGDLIVGQTESSSVSLLREAVEFPVTATVEEIYVKAGSSVKAGDPLMRMNRAQIEEGLHSYELLLEMAGLKLETAVLQQETKLLAAAQKLEESEQNGALAGETENLTVAELTHTYETAKLTMEQARKSYDEYCLLNEAFGADSAILEQYEAREAYSAEYYERISGDSENYATLSTLIRKAEEEIAAVQAGSDGYVQRSVDVDELVKELRARIEGYKDKQIGILADYQLDGYGTNTQSTTVLEERVLLAQEQWIAAEEAYSDYYEVFKEKYGNDAEAQAILKQLLSAEEALYKADLALEKARLNSITGGLSAEHAAQTAQITAETAAASYALTEMELAQGVDQAQESYNVFQKQVEDARALVGNDGIVYAPTTGMVASISVEEGDEVTVEVDAETNKIRSYATILTMTRIEDVYVPITISEEDILGVSIGQDALVTMTAFPGQSFEAQVDSITVAASRAGAATVTYAVNVVFKEKNALDIYEGMSAEVTLLDKAVLDVLYVNNAAITNTDGVSTVQVRDGAGNITARVVKTGFTDGENVEIREGLSEGDVVLAQSAVGQGGQGTGMPQQMPGGMRGS